jgi:gas vesicle protein
MKAETKQIRVDISETLIEIIAIDKINKKLAKTIEKSAKKIAKRVVNLRNKISKKAEKVAKMAIIKDLLIATKQKLKAPIEQVIVKKQLVVPKGKLAKLGVN